MRALFTYGKDIVQRDATQARRSPRRRMQFGWFLAAVVAIALSVVPAILSAGPARLGVTGANVTSIVFGKGAVVQGQMLQVSGTQWTQIEDTGEATTKFDETSRDTGSVYLTETEHGTKLQLDTVGGVVWYTDAKNKRRKAFDIISAGSTDSTKATVRDVGAPVVTGLTVTSVTFGPETTAVAEYRQVGPLQWGAFAIGGSSSVTNYREVGRNSSVVELLDTVSGKRVTIDVFNRKISKGLANAPEAFYGNVFGAGDTPVPPSATPPPAGPTGLNVTSVEIAKDGKPLGVIRQVADKEWDKIDVNGNVERVSHEVSEWRWLWSAVLVEEGATNGAQLTLDLFNRKVDWQDQSNKAAPIWDITKASSDPVEPAPLTGVKLPKKPVVDNPRVPDLVEKFAPALMFDQGSSAMGYPMDVPDFFDCIDIQGQLGGVAGDGYENLSFDGRTGGYKPSCAPKGHTGATDKSQAPSDAYLAYTEEGLVENTRTSSLTGGGAPTYYQMREFGPKKQVRIKYWWFYGFQHRCQSIGKDKLFSKKSSHSGDWEQVMVTLTEDRTGIAAVTFWQHNGWYTRISGPRDAPVTPALIGRANGARFNVLAAAPTHPIVYVERYSHGSFAKAQKRGWEEGDPANCFYFNGPRDGGSATYLFTPTKLIGLDTNAEPWMAADRNPKAKLDVGQRRRQHAPDPGAPEGALARVQTGARRQLRTEGRQLLRVGGARGRRRGGGQRHQGMQARLQQRRAHLQHGQLAMGLEYLRPARRRQPLQVRLHPPDLRRGPLPSPAARVSRVGASPALRLVRRLQGAEVGSPGRRTGLLLASRSPVRRSTGPSAHCLSRSHERPGTAGGNALCPPIRVRPDRVGSARKRETTRLSRLLAQQGRQDSNLQPPVLETGALPIAPRPWARPECTVGPSADRQLGSRCQTALVRRSPPRFGHHRAMSDVANSSADPLAELASADRILVQQVFRPIGNEYRISIPASGSSEEGRPLLHVRQKRMAIKEDIRFRFGPDRDDYAFMIKAKSVFEFRGRYDVTDADGQPIGFLAKSFAKSLLSSHWTVQDAAGTPLLEGEESNFVVALLRRFGGYIPYVGFLLEYLPFHFKLEKDGQEVGSYNRVFGKLRDRYVLEVGPGAAAVDRRLLVAFAVGLDALQDR